LNEYFTTSTLQYTVKQPLEITQTGDKFDLNVNLDGGGYKGQAEALRMAIARALVKLNPEFRKALKDKGLLTRDSRMVERKKPGQPGARKRFQFSKR
jgi:small subunit ribosomal protein S9